MTETIFQGLIGGIIIGLASSLLLIFNGRPAGISGIYNGLLQYYKGDVAWRFYFILGLLGAGILIAIFNSDTSDITTPVRSLAVIAIGGILVGFGTIMGAGCTSGHGVCGLSRFSRRSIVAVLVFMFSGFVTATLFHLITKTGGGQ